MDEFTPSERNVIVRFLHWLLRLFGWEPPTPPVEEPSEPVEPTPEPTPEPVEPDEPPEPTPQPFAVVVWPDEFVLGDSWAVRDGYVEAVQAGDGDEVDSISVTLPTAGEYTITARVLATDEHSDALYLSFNGSRDRRWPTVRGEWSTVSITRPNVNAGAYNVGIGTGEVGVLVDAIAVTSSSWAGNLDELLGPPPALPEPEPEPEPDEPEPTDPHVPPANEPAPATGTTMIGNPHYDPQQPRLKDGTLITGRALELLRGFEWWRDHPEQHEEWDTRTVFGMDDVYMLARVAREHGQMLLWHLRVVGDLRSLDAAVNWLNISRRNLKPGWRGTIKPPAGGASPYPNYVVRGGGQPDDLIGTDLSTMNEVKWYAFIAAVTYALTLNAKHASPGGLDYAEQRDYWLNHLVNEFMPKWRGGGESGWRGAHKGVRRDGRRTRASDGEWPFVVNGHEGHSTFSSSLLCYYLWRLTGEEGARSEAEAALTDWLSDTRTTRTATHGTARVWPQTLPSRGSDGWYGQGGAYIGYPSSDVIEHHLEGGFPEIVTRELLEQMAAAVASFFLLDDFGRKGKNEIATTRGICGDEPRGGMPVSRTSGPRTTLQVTINSLAILAAWEPAGRSKIADGLRELFGRSFAGTVAQPRNPFASMTLLLKELGT